MTSSRRRRNGRSDLVLDTHDLLRSAGAMREVRTIASAPPDLGIAVIGVPEGSPLKLDLRLEAVVEGVLVTGTASATLQGECVRCLAQLRGAGNNPAGRFRMFDLGAGGCRRQERLPAVEPRTEAGVGST